MPIPDNIHTSEILDMTVMKCHQRTFFLNSPPLLSPFLSPSIEKCKDYLKRESQYKGNLPMSFLIIYYLLSNFPNSLVEKNAFSIFHRRMFTWRQVFWDPYHHSHKVMEAKFKPSSFQCKRLYLLFTRSSKGNSSFLIPGKKAEEELLQEGNEGKVCLRECAAEEAALLLERTSKERRTCHTAGALTLKSHRLPVKELSLLQFLLMLGINSKVEKRS